MSGKAAADNGNDSAAARVGRARAGTSCAQGCGAAAVGSERRAPRGDAIVYG